MNWSLGAAWLMSLLAERHTNSSRTTLLTGQALYQTGLFRFEPAGGFGKAAFEPMAGREIMDAFWISLRFFCHARSWALLSPNCTNDAVSASAADCGSSSTCSGRPSAARWLSRAFSSFLDTLQAGRGLVTAPGPACDGCLAIHTADGAPVLHSSSPDGRDLHCPKHWQHLMLLHRSNGARDAGHHA